MHERGSSISAAQLYILPYLNTRLNPTATRYFTIVDQGIDPQRPAPVGIVCIQQAALYIRSWRCKRQLVCAILVFHTRLRFGRWEKLCDIPCIFRDQQICVVGQVGLRHTYNNYVMSRCAVRPWIVCKGRYSRTKMTDHMIYDIT